MVCESKDKEMTFDEIIKNSFILTSIGGFLSMIAGWLLPSDILFILGMISVVLAAGIKTVDLVMKINLKRNNEKLR